MLKIFFRCTLDIFRYIANIVKTYKKYFLDMLHIFESRKYFSGACVRNFTLLVLYTETAAERRDPVGLSICSLMSVCGLVLTYQVDTATSVDNIYLLFVIISTGLYLQLPRPGGHEQDETRVDSYPIWLLSVINC